MNNNQTDEAVGQSPVQEKVREEKTKLQISPNRTQAPKKNSGAISMAALLFALIALCASFFATYELINTISTIDYDSHIVSVPANRDAAEEKEELPASEGELFFNIKAEKDRFVVNGDIVLEIEVDKSVVTESDEVAAAPADTADEVVSGTEDATSNTEDLNKETEVNGESANTDVIKEKIILSIKDNPCSIDYAEGSDKCVLDDYIKLQLVPAEKIQNESIAVLSTDSGSTVIVMSQKLTDNTGIIGIAESSDTEAINKAKKLFVEIRDNVSIAAEDAEIKYIFNDMEINPEWTKSYKMITSVMELSDAAGEKVYLSNFTSSITGAGMTAKAEIKDGLTAVYSASIKDKNTGYIPFIYSHDNGSVKFLAKDANTLSALFVTP